MDGRIKSQEREIHKKRGFGKKKNLPSRRKLQDLSSHPAFPDKQPPETAGLHR